VNNQPTNLTPLFAAADDAVDRYINTLRAQSMTTNDLALLMLSMEQDSMKLYLAIIAATAMQRLAAQT
jgi:hypothetical protein